MIAMQNELAQVQQKILEIITPKLEDRTTIQALTSELEQKITSACKQEDVEAIVRVEGSIAKDTWLREDPDIDIFIRLPPSIPRKNLGDIGLKIAKKATAGLKQVERFAEHPYLEVFASGYRVHIVPCYNVKRGEWKSATDRTPFHTDYVKGKLSDGLRNEVRLLKKFLQGIGVYGAEIKIGGFSGYLSELLALKYGSFVGVLTAFGQFKNRLIVDIESYYQDRENELSLLFSEPLVVVDPVDRGRNVASAVQAQKLFTLVGAAREFLKNPRAIFFYPPKPKALPAEDLNVSLENRRSSVVFLAISQADAVPDVLWGQLYRTQRSLRKMVELNDYKILKDAVWSNEKTLSIFVFEVEQQVLPNVKKHLGPPLEREKECDEFLAKYINNEQVISGPYIAENRWAVLLPRKYTDIVKLFRGKLADGGKNAGVAELVAESISSKELRILVKGEVAKIYRSNPDFAEFITEFLTGKPFWLKA